MKKRIKIRISANEILFEDENYIALRKKSGWPVHKTLDRSRDNCTDALASFLKTRDSDNHNPYLTLMHRLDVYTEGIILFSRNKEANLYLQKIFEKHDISKKYLAICVGSPSEDSGTIDNYLKANRRGRIEKIHIVKSGGKRAITHYQVIDKKDGFSLVEFEIVTGRKHQIRAHAAHAGFPIYGDELYNPECSDKSGQRLCAYKLSFMDGISNGEISIEIEPNFNLENFKSALTTNSSYIKFNKPYDVLSQFGKDRRDQLSLIDFNLPKEVYPVGRLDKDSEGLLILTDDGVYKNSMAHSDSKVEKTYHIQVEGEVTQEAIDKLKKGVVIKGDYKTKPAKVKKLENIKYPPREPPIRERKNIPTSWLEIRISEGRNRQVRRMSAAVGFPTLRLIRVAIGNIKLDELAIGQHSSFDPQNRK